MAKRDYQVIDEITWSDEYLASYPEDKREEKKHSTLKMSYTTLSKAFDEAKRCGLNRAVEAKTTRIIYKPTGEVVASYIW